MSRPSPAWYAALVSLVGLLIGPPLAAEELGALPAVREGKVTDVALDPQQRLHGQVLTPNGEPLSGVKLSFRQGGRQLVDVEADNAGRFECVLPRGGVYQLMAADQPTSIRVWTAQAAPPGCARELVVVSGDVLRGQGGHIPYTQVNPWLVAGVVAVAVAIPVVLSNHRSDRGDGS